MVIIIKKDASQRDQVVFTVVESGRVVVYGTRVSCYVALLSQAMLIEQEYVRITPIISRHKGVEVAELGAGGGQGDLDQQYELDLDDSAEVSRIMTFCVSELRSQPDLSSAVLQMLTSACEGRKKKLALDPSRVSELYTSLQQLSHIESEQKLPIKALVPLLVKHARQTKGNSTVDQTEVDAGLPKQIKFPCSRHSSYEELCLLIDAFKPKSIYPCTVDEPKWTLLHSMGYLFGHLYEDPPVFSHDEEMLGKLQVIHASNMDSGIIGSSYKSALDAQTQEQETPASVIDLTVSKESETDEDSTSSSQDVAAVRRALRYDAYNAALGRGASWFDIELVSVRGHQNEEEELL